MHINDIDIKTSVTINDAEFIIDRLWFNMRTDPVWKDHQRWNCNARFVIDGQQHTVDFDGPTLDDVKNAFLQFVTQTQRT